MGTVEKKSLCTHFLPRVTVRDITTRMGLGVLGCLVIMALYCMGSCSCKVAHQAHSNEVQQERRKIVKLILRNFPLQDSSSYKNLVEEDEEHNLVEDEDKEHNLLEDHEEKHPQFQEGYPLAQYAPLYPYEDQPFDSEQVNVNTTIEATEDNADIYYQGYTYPNSNLKIDKIIQEAKEDNADLYYGAYVHPNDNIQEIEPSEENADVYYEGYIHPTTNLEIRKAFEEPIEDNVDSYYEEHIQDNANIKLIKSFEEPSEENADEYYKPYMHISYNLPYSQYTRRLEDASEHTENNELRNEEHENEIFDAPKIIVKLQN